MLTFFQAFQFNAAFFIMHDFHPRAIFQSWARMRRLATELQTHLRLSSTARLAKCHSGLAFNGISRQI